MKKSVLKYCSSYRQKNKKKTILIIVYLKFKVDSTSSFKATWHVKIIMHFVGKCVQPWKINCTLFVTLRHGSAINSALHTKPNKNFNRK